jgi:hypothetical protein
VTIAHSDDSIGRGYCKRSAMPRTGRPSDRFRGFISVFFDLDVFDNASDKRVLQTQHGTRSHTTYGTPQPMILPASWRAVPQHNAGHTPPTQQIPTPTVDSNAMPHMHNTSANASFKVLLSCDLSCEYHTLRGVGSLPILALDVYVNVSFAHDLGSGNHDPKC